MTQTREARQNFDVATLRGTVKWVPISFHLVARSNGTGGLNQGLIPTMIQDLNTAFGPANIQFFQCGAIEVIQNDLFYDLRIGARDNPAPSEDDLLCDAHDVPNTLNMYFAQSLYSEFHGVQANGLAYFPGGPERVFIENARANVSRTVEHEVGHFFSLYHTHQNFDNPALSECVNGSNCATAGDEVCDTPAEPNLANMNLLQNCVYIGSGYDYCGQPYALTANNYMSYAYNCGNRFTPGQYNRMAYSAIYERANLACPNPANLPCTSIITTFPYVQSFESGNLGDWANATGDNFNWSVVSAGPHAPTTGPSAAADGTKFAYIEANGNTSNQIAVLTMPCFDLTNLTNPRLEFRYHMVGAGTGTLRLEASTSGGATWTTLFYKDGPQASGWQTQVVNLGTYASQTTLQLRFSATTTTNALGDIAIDYFRVYAAPCAFTPTIAHTDLTCSYLPTGQCTISNAPVGSTYAWASGNAPAVTIGTGASISALGPGPYQVTVTSGGCASVHGAYVEEKMFRIVATTVQPTFANPLGNISVTWQGGMLPYSVLSWAGPVSGSTTSFGSGSLNLNALPAGNYQFTMTDAIGCVIGTTESLEMPVSDLPCQGAITVGMTQTFESGLGDWALVSPLTNYGWAIGTGDMAPTSVTGPTNTTAPNAPNGAFAGNNYAYAVSANFDRNLNMEAFLSSPCLNFTGVAHPAVRFRYHNFHTSGTVDPLTVILYHGATGDFEVLWQSDAVSSDAWREALVDLSQAGNSNLDYQVLFYVGPAGTTTNDIALDNIEFFDGGAGGFTTSITSTPASCGSTATATVTASCGGAISYQWSHGPTTASVTSLAPNNTYYVTVTCTGAILPHVLKVETYTSEILPTTYATHVITAGQSNGAVDLVVTGGKPPYTYNWSGPGGFSATTQDIANRPVGTYNVTVTDAMSCTKTASATILDGTCPNIVNASGYDESWEADFGKWKNITGEAASHFDWTRATGASAGTSSGPAGANHGSYYLYVNSSTTASGATAHLVSYCIDLRRATAATFSYDWHAYKTTTSGTMGSLYLDVSTNQGSTWTQIALVCSTSVGNQWNVANQSLNSYLGKVIQLRFREVMGTTNKGDIALDHPRITGTFTKMDETNSEPQLSAATLFPNPTQDRVHVRFHSAHSQSLACTVTDLSGKALSTWQNEVSEGENEIEFDTRDLADGIYFLQMEMNGQRITKRFVVMQ